MALHKATAFSIAIALILGAIMVVVTWEADPDEPLPNEVHFPVACSEWSQRVFDHATSLLHSLRYVYSESSYAAITKHEPDCAMAYWGIAMSRLKRPIAAPPSADEVRAARAALQGALLATAASPREQGYIDALRGLVADGALADWHERTLRYAQAMEAVAHDNPQDREATIFYALALNMAGPAFANDYSNRTKASELLLIALSEQPNHPGIAHYLTYCLNNVSAADREPMASRSTGMKSQTRLFLLSGLGGLLAFALCSLAILGPGWADSASNSIGGPFTLSAANGHIVRDAEFRGKWLLVYFGYTHCPDVCPTTLLEIAHALAKLGRLAAELQPIFITIDPERDTPDIVGDYVKAFDPRIIGLSGSPEEVAKVAKEYRVYYKKEKPPGALAEDYLMQHSAFVYVMGPSGAYVTLFAPQQGQGAEQMASRLHDLMNQASR